MDGWPHDHKSEVIALGPISKILYHSNHFTTGGVGKNKTKTLLNVHPINSASLDARGCFNTHGKVGK